MRSCSRRILYCFYDTASIKMWLPILTVRSLVLESMKLGPIAVKLKIISLQFACLIISILGKVRITRLYENY